MPVQRVGHPACMMASPLSITVSLSLCVLPLLVYSTIRWLRSTRRPPGFPPGPPTSLGLGNLHQVPRLWSHLKLHEWAKQYGPIMGLKFGPHNVVILNDGALVHELLVKRAVSFSERPSIHIAQEHILPEAKHTYTLYMRNDESRRLRTMAKSLLTGSGLSNVAPLHKAAGARLAYSLLEPHEEMTEALMPWSVSSPVAMMSGVPIQDFIQDYGKSWIGDYYYSQKLWIELLDPSSPPVDYFPILRWVPSAFAAWKRKAPIARKALIQAYEGLMAQAQKSLQRHGGTFRSLSLIPSLIREDPQPLNPKEELERTTFMGGIFDAAVGSSLMAFETLILALASHPETQRRAQAEVDSVFGRDAGLPDRIDLDKLPYMTACMYESQRWRPIGAYPVGAFGLPRRTIADEEVLGYRIPKGTSVLLNQWTIAHDPAFYEDPDRFDPERFVRDPVGAKAGVAQPGRKPIYTFGAGRRECLGKEFALQNIRIAAAQLLWAYEIVPAGPLATDVQSGFAPAVVMKANSFKVNFVPRKDEEVLLEEKLKADTVLSELLGERV